MKLKFADRIAHMKPSAIREILKASNDPNVISFAAGNPAPEAFPVELVRKISDELFETDPIAVLQYSVTEGYGPLRDRLKVVCREHYHVGTDDDDIILLSGGQQGADLAARCMCNRGDVVLCEDPSFVGCLNSFRQFQAKLVGIEMDEEGINLEKLEAAIHAHENIAFLYLIPTFQNPTGLTMSAKRRREVYDLCKKHQILIVEDNPYTDTRFRGEAVDPIKSLDDEGLVLYLGSFSKILAPGIRLGYAVGPKELIGKMATGKQGEDVHSTIWSQRVAYRFLESVNLDEYAKHLGEIYQKKCDLMLSLLDEMVGNKIQYTRPEGGLFIWCTLPDGVDMLDFCNRCAEHKLSVVPGNAFLAEGDEGKTQSFRINYSTPTDEQLREGVKILAEVINETIR
mgnify:CR=1 FL=1